MSKRRCKECHDTFRGRSDKIYCSDQCRSAANNRKNSDTRFMRKVHRVLKKNRKILKTFVENKMHRIHRDKLLLEGFAFRYCTQVELREGGRSTRYCYDMAYQIEDNSYVEIIESS